MDKPEVSKKPDGAAEKPPAKGRKTAAVSKDLPKQKPAGVQKRKAPIAPKRPPVSKVPATAPSSKPQALAGVAIVSPPRRAVEVPKKTTPVVKTSTKGSTQSSGEGAKSKSAENPAEKKTTSEVAKPNAETSTAESSKKKPAAKTFVVPKRAEDESLPRSKRPMRPMFIPQEALVLSKPATSTDKKEKRLPREHSARGRGRGRGGIRGGGRGGSRAPVVKNTYTAEEIEKMQTHELMPSLSMDLGSKAERRKRFEEADRARNEKVVGYVDEKFAPKAKDPAKTGLAAYEELWESDQEADEEGLEELRLNYQIEIHGDVVPRCLPHKDMPEIVAVTNCNKFESYVEPQICSRTNEVIPTPTRTVKSLRNIGGSKLKALHDQKFQKPMLFQFPAGMSTFANSKIMTKQEYQTVMGGSEPQAEQSETTAEISAVNVFDDDYAHGMEDIPGGTSMGKLVFTKKGKCYLKINGSNELINVSRSMQENKIKNVMAFLPENEDDEQPMELAGSSHSVESKKGHLLGVADNFFVCSYDTATICRKYRQEAAATKKTSSSPGLVDVAAVEEEEEEVDVTTVSVSVEKEAEKPKEQEAPKKPVPAKKEANKRRANVPKTVAEK